MNKKLIIIGASGHGKVCADIALEMNQWEEICFLDDNENIKESLGLSVIGKSSGFEQFVDEYDFFVGIGSNNTRKRIIEKLKRINASITTLVHPNAIIGRDVEIQNGTVIMAGVVINCSTSIGEGCIINTGATVDHDCDINEYVHISPGVNVAGTVNIGNNCWIGIGASIINNICICNDVIIGSGGVVVSNIVERGTYIGVPVKVVKNEGYTYCSSF
ncbi:MAG: acetyltransferase [Clostridia bacterium]|nr:acetyltransferase [Clostridia bacterium]